MPVTRVRFKRFFQARKSIFSGISQWQWQTASKLKISTGTDSWGHCHTCRETTCCWRNNYRWVSFSQFHLSKDFQDLWRVCYSGVCSTNWAYKACGLSSRMYLGTSHDLQYEKWKSWRLGLEEKWRYVDDYFDKIATNCCELPTIDKVWM